MTESEARSQPASIIDRYRRGFVCTSVLLFLTAHSMCSGQSTQSVSDPYPITRATPFSRIGISAWSAGGTGVADAGLPGAPFANPATLRLQGPSVYIEAGKKFSTTWILDLDYDGQFFIPAYISIGTLIGTLSLEGGYANTYNERFSSTIPVTTEQFPDGTGQFIDFEEATNVHAFYGSLGFFPSDHLSLGMTAGVNYIRTHESLGQVSGTGSGTGIFFNLGVLVQPLPVISLGATFKYSLTIDYSLRYDGLNLLQSDSTRGNYYRVDASFPYRATFPWIAEVGAKWDLSANIGILASVEYQKWSLIGDYFQDRFNVHMGTAYELSPTFSLRLGFFTQYDPSKSTGAYTDQDFLTAGIQWTATDGVIISAGILDSHLFGKSPSQSYFWNTNNTFHQTYISAGVGYDF
ncbi:MAG: hypothetical protein HY033_05965 [Ignavibacteriae bacterium]|nr:hypothetical protein [Ignavibacteria bacterium]MBI3364437.1 hypothetical protein [Ignavibacteriota bacterium]